MSKAWQQVGRVESLHLHPADAGQGMASAASIELEINQGIREDARYFGRPTRRQVTLIEREQLAEHAVALGLEAIHPGEARSNIETSGINFRELVGRHAQVGEAVLHLYAPRDPCAKMDAICPGLRKLMGDGRQGVLATVVQSGIIRVGDAIRIGEPPVPVA